jgi:hypothetical protein
MNEVPLWGATGYECDSVSRTLFGDLDLSDITGITVSAFGYFGMSWGHLATLYASSSQSIIEFMPSGNNIGAYVQLMNLSGSSLYHYMLDYRPSLTEYCITCDAFGELLVYEDGTLIDRAQLGTDGFSAIRAIRRLCIGGEITIGAYVPAGSSLYGVTVYRSVLDASEVASLHDANVKNLTGDV